MIVIHTRLPNCKLAAPTNVFVPVLKCIAQFVSFRKLELEPSPCVSTAAPWRTRHMMYSGGQVKLHVVYSFFGLICSNLWIWTRTQINAFFVFLSCNLNVYTILSWPTKCKWYSLNTATLHCPISTMIRPLHWVTRPASQKSRDCTYDVT